MRPDLPRLHRITWAYFLERNRDPIARAAKELARRPWRALEASVAAGKLVATTCGIGCLDIDGNDHPHCGRLQKCPVACVPDVTGTAND